MTNILKNGDYQSDGNGGILRDDSGLAEALFRMTCRRGTFPWLPKLGSRLDTLGREKSSALAAAARRFAAEALEEMPIRVTDASVTTDGDRARVHITLCTEDENTLEVTV